MTIIKTLQKELREERRIWKYYNNCTRCLHEPGISRHLLKIDLIVREIKDLRKNPNYDGGDLEL